METDLTEAVGPAGARAGSQDCLVTGRKLQRDREGGGHREPQWICEQGNIPCSALTTLWIGWAKPSRDVPGPPTVPLGVRGVPYLGK